MKAAMVIRETFISRTTGAFAREQFPGLFTHLFRTRSPVTVSWLLLQYKHHKWIAFLHQSQKIILMQQDEWG